MARKFKTGDKVRLVSDSEENNVMTVREYVEDILSKPIMGKELLRQHAGKVVCDWRDKQDKPQCGYYSEEELMNV